MFLTDKQIKKLCKDNKLIIENYQEENVGAVSYDLTVKDVIAVDEDNKKYNSYELKPGQTVFVSSLETLELPDDCVGIVTEKNSVMRQGLTAAAPYYQPGHKTRAYIRITNISGNIITVTSGKRIAQVFFTRLSEKPEKPYPMQSDASFNDELDFKGFGKYESEYEKEIKKINKVKEDLDEKANSIYANVMVFMGIIAAIFTIVTVNFEAFSGKNFSVLNVLSLNLSLAFAIAVFSGIVMFFIGKKRSKITYFVYILITALILAANVLLSFINI